MRKYKENLMVCIVRGTQTKIAVIGIKAKGFDLIFDLDYQTAHVRNLSELIIKTIDVAKENANIKIKKAVIAAAGPVSRTRVKVNLTRTELRIIKEDLLERTGLKEMWLMNDYEAISYGIDLLNRQTDLIKIPHIDEELASIDTRECTIAVIGSERGLGMAIGRYDSNTKLHASIPSEGGHIEFCAGTELENNFQKYLQKGMKNKKALPGYEMILCNKGLSTLYDFIVSQKAYSNKTARMITRLKDDEKLEAIQANYHLIKACRITLDQYMIFYARACKAIALMSQCYSGLYITDMLVLRNTKSLEEKNKLLKVFMTEFENTETRNEVLRKIPVFLITNKKTALLGCYNYVSRFIS